MVRIQCSFSNVLYTKQSTIHNSNVMTQFLRHIEIQIHFFGVIHDNIDMPQNSYSCILHTAREQRRLQFSYKHWRKKIDEFKNKIILRIKQKGGREKETTHKNQFISFRTL